MLHGVVTGKRPGRASGSRRGRVGAPPQASSAKWSSDRPRLEGIARCVQSRARHSGILNGCPAAGLWTGLPRLSGGGRPGQAVCGTEGGRLSAEGAPWDFSRGTFPMGYR